jgi:hypothetical protein
MLGSTANGQLQSAQIQTAAIKQQEKQTKDNNKKTRKMDLLRFFTINMSY